MTTDLSYLDYELEDGYIHNWLVLGPRLLPLDEGTDTEAEAWHTPVEPPEDPVDASEIAATAVEPDGPLADVVTVGDYSGQWHYTRCLEDHIVAARGKVRADRVARPHLSRAWAYTELEIAPGAASASETDLHFVITTAGAADVWVNDEHVQRVVIGAARAKSVTFAVTLRAGRNPVLVRFEALADAGVPQGVALRVIASDGVTATQGVGRWPTVVLPTRIARLPRRKWLEGIFESATLPRYVFDRREPLMLVWPLADGAFPADSDRAEPEDAELTMIELPAYPDEENPDGGNVGIRKSEAPAVGMTSLSIRVQDPMGRVYNEANIDVKAGSRAEMGFTYRYPDGPLEGILMPRPREQFEGKMWITRRVSFWSLDNNTYTDEPAADYQERRRQALARAARREANVYSEIAKMAIGWWSRIETRLIGSAIAELHAAHSLVYRDAVGLLSMVMRYGEAPEFPDAIAADLAAALPGIVFHDELPPGAQRSASEAGRLLSAVCEILAGQLAPEATFTATGQSGAWHRERGEQTALVLMRRMGMRGLQAWGSDVVLEELFLALAHIIDFAEDDVVWDLAMVLMDKLLFLLATHTYKGIHGCARVRTTTAAVLGGYLDATSGISKLMWGMGIDTPHIRAVVSLACMEDYELPALLQSIAADHAGTELWSIERHAPQDEDVTLAIYRTAGGLLSSVQDYAPGAPGTHEHVWQATLGAGATVFVNHPVRAGLEDDQGPNFWRGNGVLPRVAQWRDALIALYRLPADDWLGYTHAYFPIHAFDEVAIREGWAFARKGDGYLALWASRGLELIDTGPSANRELRSYGAENVWLCQMGRAAQDGDFAVFQARVIGLPPAVDALTGEGVRWTTVRGDDLQLDWADPLLRNGAVVDNDDGTHINNAYCVAALPASTMDIRYGDIAMRLNFAPQDSQDGEGL